MKHAINTGDHDKYKNHVFNVEQVKPQKGKFSCYKLKNYEILVTQ